MPPERITRFFDMSREMFTRFFGMSREVFQRASSGKKLRVKKLLSGKFQVFVPLAVHWWSNDTGMETKEGNGRRPISGYFVFLGG